VHQVMVRKAAKKAASSGDVLYPDGCEPIDPDTNNSTLVLALKALYERISDDDTPTVDNFESLSTHLISPQLVNKPADVSVYVALCLARIFVILNPNNPFELRNAELRDALEFLAKSLGRIRSENEALYTRYHSLLEMVSNSGIVQQHLRSLDADTEDGAKVIATLLKSAALIVEVRKASERVQDEKNEQESERKNGVKTMMMTICRGVFEENADHIHGCALDVIFSHLISPEKINNPEAYHFMRSLCEHGSVYIHQRISRIFVDAFQTQDDPKFDTEVFKLVGKRKGAVYELLSELSDVLPDIRNDLLGLLSIKLASPEVEVRLLALKTSSEVARSRFDLPESCPSLWQRFVDRSKDSSQAVRKEFAERVAELIYSNHDMRSTIWTHLDSLVVDVDEEVRMAAIQTVCQTARKKLEAVNEKLIESCTERLRDRKVEVRKVALKFLLGLYKDVVRRDDSTKSDRASMAIIVKRVIQLNRGPVMTDERVIVEKGLINSLLPIELPMRKRMELLVEMCTRLSAQEIKIVQEMLQKVVTGRRVLSEMMDCISVRKNEEPAMEKSQEQKKRVTQACIERLVKYFPNPQKAEGALRKFTNLLCTDNEAVRQMEVILRKETTVMEAQTAVKLLLSRIGNAKDEMNKEQEEMIRSLLSRIAPLLIDHSSLLELTRYVSEIIDGESIGKEEAVKIIKRAVSIHKLLSDIYPSNINQFEIVHILLTKFLESHDQFVVKCGLQCIHVMLAKEAGRNGENIRHERWFQPMKDALLVQIREGKPSCAKHALRDICHMLGSEESWELLKEDIENLMENLDATQETTARSLCLLRKAVQAWKEHLIEKIMTIYPLEIARKILVPDPATYNGGVTIDFNPADKNTLEEIPVSPSMTNTLAAIKLAVRILPMFPPGNHSNTLIQKTINVLSLCATEKGRVADEITDSDAAWLTALSGSALVRLMSHRRISRDFITPSVMSSLAQVATHPLETVRLYLINRVYKYYRMAMLISPFLALIPLSQTGLTKGIDNEEEERLRRASCDLFIGCITTRNQHLHLKKTEDTLYKCEMFVPHLISLLAEIPTLTNNKDEEELTRIAECLWSTIESMVKVKGMMKWELICALLNQLKTVIPRMNEDEGDRVQMAKKVWAVSEIMLHLILYKAKIVTGLPEKNAPLLTKFFETRKGDNNTVYAPTSLLKRIEEGRIAHEFTKLKMSSTMLKEETKTNTKGRGRGKRKVKKEEEESDDEMQFEDEPKMPSTSRRGRPLKKTMERVEEEDEDMEEEEGEEEGRGEGKILNGKGKMPVNRRLTSMRELESINLSPIGGSTRRRGGLAASTPIVKNGMEGREKREEEEGTPKKRGRSTTSSMNSSPLKLLSKSPSKSPQKLPQKTIPQNGNRKRSSRVEGREEEEEEEEEKAPPPAKRGRGRGSVKREEKEPKPTTRTSRGKGKKKEEEVEEN
ncbi:hypothetical protein PFISCL1PPCAC_10625, partial [Pristionchus fissidentatus]